MSKIIPFIGIMIAVTMLRAAMPTEWRLITRFLDNIFDARAYKKTQEMLKEVGLPDFGCVCSARHGRVAIGLADRDAVAEKYISERFEMQFRREPDTETLEKEDENFAIFFIEMGVNEYAQFIPTINAINRWWQFKGIGDYQELDNEFKDSLPPLGTRML